MYLLNIQALLLIMQNVRNQSKNTSNRLNAYNFSLVHNRIELRELLYLNRITVIGTAGQDILLLTPFCTVLNFDKWSRIAQQSNVFTFCDPSHYCAQEGVISYSTILR